MTSPHIFTANFGNFDTPKKQPIPVSYYDETNARYPMHTQDNRMKAKFYKMLSHRVTDAKVIGWVDGNVQIKHERFISDMLQAMGDADVVISKHPVRASPYDEAIFIAQEVDKGNEYIKKRYNSRSILLEVEIMPTFYQHAPLFWCGLFLRRNNPKVNAAFEDWFMENVLWTNFDQNSFVKIIHKHGLKVSTIDWGDFYDNEHYSLVKHKG